jgi:hypothetical protein
MCAFLPDTEREAAAKLGMDKPTKLELALCMEPETAEQLAANTRRPSSSERR